MFLSCTLLQTNTKKLLYFIGSQNIIALSIVTSQAHFLKWILCHTTEWALQFLILS